MTQSLSDRLEKVFCNIFHDVPPVEIRQLTKRNAAHWDSLAQLNLIISIEEEFDIQIQTEEGVDVTSFASALALLQEKHIS